MALKKKENMVSLNIKISGELDRRLKRARIVAREQGQMFNVSNEVSSFLEKELKKVEKCLGITQNVDEEASQMDLIDRD
jgi:hypothetical protein